MLFLTRVKILLSVCSSLGSQSASNVGPHSVRQRNAIPLAFRWRAESGPLLHAYWANVRSKVVTSLQPLRMAPVAKFEALPVVLGNRETWHLFQGNRGTKAQFEGNRGKQRQYCSTENIIRKHIFDFGGTGEQANLFQGISKQVPPGWASCLQPVS